MNCIHCAQRAIWLHPALCGTHYTKYFEQKVTDTITEHELLTKNQRVCVAVSGGKDSLTILHILHKNNHDVTGLLVDEGIAGYREHTITEAQRFCEENNIPLRIVSFKEFTGQALDDMLTNKDLRACTVCGTFRRHLLNKYAAGFDVVATGHNADDEAQAILMNILRAHATLIARAGPKTASGTNAFVQRIKPLYFCTEKEIMTYAIIQGFASDWNECPNAKTSYRARVRDVLNAYEQQHPGAKQRVLQHHLSLDFPQEHTLTSACMKCGAACTGDTCASCRMLVVIQ